MSQPQPPPQASRPAKTGDETADLAATLAWLKTTITATYLAGSTSPFQDGPPKVTPSVYLDIFSATLDYCEGCNQLREPGATSNLNSPQRGHPENWATADLYTGLRDAIKTHCVDIRTRLFAPENSAGVGGARHLVGEYVAHWKLMVHLATYVSNLLRYLERKWIKRCMDEGQRDIHMIKDLHTMICKEEVFTSVLIRKPLEVRWTGRWRCCKSQVKVESRAMEIWWRGSWDHSTMSALA